MLAYLANTLIFIMVGVVIMEKALNSLNEYDLFLLVVDYFGITVIRLVKRICLKLFHFHCHHSKPQSLLQQPVQPVFSFPSFQRISNDDIQPHSDANWIRPLMAECCGSSLGWIKRSSRSGLSIASLH